MAKVNNTFFEELGRSPKVVALVNQVRDQVAAAARASAPVDSGDYKRGIIATGKVEKKRYVGLVVATDPKSLLIESKMGVLARALRSVGHGRR
ncbi:hypothetical protein [Microbacterium soli]|uniref:HK97 gp10 family phage protein n=1 Tax=Microbacterium soli TaxID=446075 RepID=A0ABP7NIK5_9MICO